MDYPSALVVLGVAAGLCVLVWLYFRAALRKRELAHAERMKALEAGQKLPDLAPARANPEAVRCRVLGMVGLCLPLGAILAAGALTLVLCRGAEVTAPTSVFYLIWIVCGVIGSLGVLCMAMLSDSKDDSDDGGEPEKPDLPPLPPEVQRRSRLSGPGWRNRR